MSDDIRSAAQKLRAASTGNWVHQAHEIVLRDADAAVDNPKVLRLIPLGDFLGVAITDEAEPAIDEAILFVSLKALGSSLAALGFTLPTIHTCSHQVPARE